MPKADKNKINIKERVDDDTIDLSLSEISEIPVKDIAPFKRATILDLSSNQITTLGKNFGMLSHLTKLDLSKNQIKFLPEDIGKLVNLRHFDLYNNKLEHLPLGMGQMKALRYLDLKANPITPALAKIVGNCLTTKECQDCAKKTVKFLAEMQVRIYEEREKLKQAEKDKQQEEIVEEIPKKIEEKPKTKAKKEKKKDKSQKNKINSNKNTVSSESISSTCSFIKFFLFIILLSFLFVIGFAVVLVKYPQYVTVFIQKLPSTYQPMLIKYEETLQTYISKLFDIKYSFIHN